MESNAKLEGYTLKPSGVGAGVPGTLPAQHPPFRRKSTRQMEGTVEA